MNTNHLDSDLPRWSDIQEKKKWDGLLVGNGASQAIWRRFGYTSLYEKAAQTDMDSCLNSFDQRLFEALDTRNFEAVLGALAMAKMVCVALGRPIEAISERYDSIQAALINAVNRVHLPWALLDAEKKSMVRKALLSHDKVFSTNYDLLIYWAIMHDDGAGIFKDYFWHGRFDITDTTLWDDCTAVLYMHGGLHIYRTPYGETLKRAAQHGQNLLQLFGTPYRDNALPLFVSEGTAQDKLRSIQHSDYLSFALEQFAQYREPVVVFGHGLGESDAHIVAAMKGWKERAIAFAILPDDDRKVMAKKAVLHDTFRNAQLYFFDALTHPLGSPQLQVKDDEDEY